MSTNAKPTNLGRHKRNCTICSHSRRQEIEADFIAWRSPVAIAGEYGLADRASVYRHAHALGLFEQRQRNVKAALERIIERAGDVEVNASAVVSAIQAYAKINENGRWVDRSEQVSVNEFERWTDEELARYAAEGVLPDWAQGGTSLHATGRDSRQ